MFVQISAVRNLARFLQDRAQDAATIVAQDLVGKMMKMSWILVNPPQAKL